MPKGLSEEFVLATIEKVVNVLAPGFTFGTYGRDDVAQESRIFALQALSKYDGIRPLDGFLFFVIKSHLINLKRNLFRRSDAPCLSCHNGEPCNEGDYCKKYKAWLDRNSAKSNIMSPLDLGAVNEQQSNARCESTMSEEVEIGELCSLIDEKLDVGLRESYLKMRARVSVPKAKRLEVEAAVVEILRGG